MNEFNTKTESFLKSARATMQDDLSMRVSRVNAKWVDVQQKTETFTTRFAEAVNNYTSFQCK